MSCMPALGQPRCYCCIPFMPAFCATQHGTFKRLYIDFLLSVPGPDVSVPPVCSLACFTPGNVGACPFRHHQQACGLGSWASGLVHVVHLNARRCAAEQPFGHVLVEDLLAPQLQQTCSRSASAFSLHHWKTGIGVCESLSAHMRESRHSCAFIWFRVHSVPGGTGF